MESSGAYILDASVGVKWVLPAADEPLSQAAAAVLSAYSLGQYRLIVPDLFWIEVGNVLWKACRQGRIRPALARTALLWMQDFGFETVPSFGLAPKAVHIALAWERSVYDATYLALARLSDQPLLTADERLVRAMERHFPVRWLGALG
jgi:predicted nucleic acid-binding protein